VPSKIQKTIFLLGATAVGKTSVAIELALRVGGEIVSADSMQLYRGMNIGTAKPSLEERRGVPHHLFDILNINEHCDVALFRKQANDAIEAIQSRNAVPIVVGGSGMYVRALTRGLFEGPGRDESFRDQLNQLQIEDLRKCLVDTDPIAAAKIGVNDRKRILRALEIFHLTGKSITELQNEWGPLQSEISDQILIMGLSRPREELYRRCNLRVDRMFELGFVDEVRLLVNEGLDKSPTASKAIGYAEVINHLKGEIDLPKTIELVKQKTRNFVKRQLSWFKKESGVQWLELSEQDDEVSIVSRIVEII
jgi:tRNA dimethylallyltransferase